MRVGADANEKGIRRDDLAMHGVYICALTLAFTLVGEAAVPETDIGATGHTYAPVWQATSA